MRLPNNRFSMFLLFLLFMTGVALIVIPMISQQQEISADNNIYALLAEEIQVQAAANPEPTILPETDQQEETEPEPDVTESSEDPPVAELSETEDVAAATEEPASEYYVAEPVQPAETLMESEPENEAEQPTEQDVPETEDGKKFGIGEGSLIPIGFLSNHMIDILDDDAKEAEDSSLDDVVLFRGTVKKIYVGKVKFGEMDEDNSFMKCIIDTQFGDLMLIHTYNQIAEDFRKNIKVGAVVAGQCIISGDPAIDEYKDGLILDEEHDLRALRYSFIEGQSERLNNILEKDVLFTSDTTGKSFLGSDSVMDRIDVVTDRRIKQGLG